MTQLLYILMNYLNNSFKKDTNYYIAQTLTHNIDKISNWSLEYAAICCNVSVSTLNRFFHDIGYKNFSRMKEIIYYNEEYKSIRLNSDSMDKAVEAIKQTLDNINKIDLEVFNEIADYIFKSKQVIFYAYGENLNFTLKTQVELMLNGKYSISRIDILRQMDLIKEVDEDDLIICISISGRSIANKDLKTIINTKNCKSILITQIQDCSSFDYFDFILNLGPNYGYNSSKYAVEYLMDLICSAYKSRVNFL
ncbi:MurR/RpiR family transcriptional regulator [Trichococcus alkaliphilus]|uniref:MurR/RpiR family transcriptional regulator n=1 Tax=Trichococcus alkaliphilus TaxID=2052943 RepID=UPI000D0B866E|nr:SIS domain-containing protein [Trichococcus alkaliphilus]